MNTTSMRDSATTRTSDQPGTASAATPTLCDLLPRHLPQIENYVRRHMGRTLRDHESATDLVASVCGDLLAEGGAFEYRGEAQFHGWLRAAVINKIRYRLRSFRAKKRCPGHTQGDGYIAEVPAGGNSPLHGAMLRENLVLLDRALERMPDHYREVIVRIRLRGESRTQVAADLGRTLAATANLLTRALVKLAAEMDRLQQGR